MVQEAAASTSLERAGANFYQLFSELQVDRRVNCAVQIFSAELRCVLVSKFYPPWICADFLLSKVENQSF